MKNIFLKVFGSTKVKVVWQERHLFPLYLFVFYDKTLIRDNFRIKEDTIKNAKVQMLLHESA